MKAAVKSWYNAKGGVQHDVLLQNCHYQIGLRKFHVHIWFNKAKLPALGHLHSWHCRYPGVYGKSPAFLIGIAQARAQNMTSNDSIMPILIKIEQKPVSEWTSFYLQPISYHQAPFPQKYRYFREYHGSLQVEQNATLEPAKTVRCDFLSHPCPSDPCRDMTARLYPAPTHKLPRCANWDNLRNVISLFLCSWMRSEFVQMTGK